VSLARVNKKVECPLFFFDTPPEQTTTGTAQSFRDMPGEANLPLR
jgi:hypothetical protein